MWRRGDFQRHLDQLDPETRVYVQGVSVLLMALFGLIMLVMAIKAPVSVPLPRELKTVTLDDFSVDVVKDSGGRRDLVSERALKISAPGGAVYYYRERAGAFGSVRRALETEEPIALSVIASQNAGPFWGPADWKQGVYEVKTDSFSREYGMIRKTLNFNARVGYGSAAALFLGIAVVGVRNMRKDGRMARRRPRDDDA